VPNNILDSWSDKYKIPKKELEGYWDRAKKETDDFIKGKGIKKDSGTYYGIVTSILKRMIKNKGTNKPLKELLEDLNKLCHS
jgi:hypothetical protein